MDFEKFEIISFTALLILNLGLAIYFWINSKLNYYLVNTIVIMVSIIVLILLSYLTYYAKLEKRPREIGLLFYFLLVLEGFMFLIEILSFDILAFVIIISCLIIFLILIRNEDLNQKIMDNQKIISVLIFIFTYWFSFTQWVKRDVVIFTTAYLVMAIIFIVFFIIISLFSLLARRVNQEKSKYIRFGYNFVLEISALIINYCPFIEIIMISYGLLFCLFILYIFILGNNWNQP